MLVDTKTFPYRVDIPWRRGDTINSWDQVCVKAIDTYGLPGYRYMTDSSTDEMIFYFKFEEDAMWFRLSSQ